MNIIELSGDLLVIRMTDGVAVINLNELIMGNDNTVVGHFFHVDFPSVPQGIIRLSNTAQQILSFLLTGKVKI